MIDNYPSRVFDTGQFIDRKEPVVYSDKWLSNYEATKYVTDGYVLIKGFFNNDLINRCYSSAPNGLVTPEPNAKEIRSITGFHFQEPFSSVAKSTYLLAIVKSILGGEIYIHQSRINYKKPIVGSGWYWHSDFETWHVQDGMPAMRCVSAMIPLTENTETNGSLMVIPGSHKYFYSAPRPDKNYSAEENFADQKEGVPDEIALEEFFKRCDNRIKMIKCSPGDLVLFDCNLIHVSTANLSPMPRTNLFFVYNSIENQLINPTRPVEMGTREIVEVL
jgi:ectoine hydroxylase